MEKQLSLDSKMPSTMPELRPYQMDLVDRIERIWADRADAGIMLQLITGGGKTEIAAALAMRAVNAGEPVTFVPHMQGLVGQTTQRFLKYGMPAVAGSGAAGYTVPKGWPKDSGHPGGVVVIGVETWKHRTNQGKDSTGLLIVDEAHITGGNGRRQGMIAAHRGPLLCLTATPYRMSDREDFRRICQRIVCGPTMRELIDDEWLADFVHYSLDGAGMRIRETKQPESDEVFASRVWKEATAKERSTLCETAVEWWLKFPDRQVDSKTICFALTREHAHRLAELVENAGCRAVVLEYETADKPGVLAEFKKPIAQGGAHMLINVNMLREGFDAPDADILLGTRQTKSLALYLQMAGRVLRPKKPARKAIILDLVDNAATHGLLDQEREWTLDGAKEKETGGESPVMVCRGPARLDQDGYVVVARGDEKPPTAFTGAGCGAFNPPGAYECAGCGGQFRRVCSSVEADGCGRHQSVKRWRGKFRSWKQGACDRCGEMERDAQMAVAGMEGEVRLHWNPAVKGNGYSLRFAVPGHKKAGIWIGRQRHGMGYRVWDDEFASTAAGQRIVRLARGAMAERGLLDPRSAVEQAIVEMYEDLGPAAALAYGALCPQCKQRFYNGQRFQRCYDCQTGQSALATVAAAPAVTPAPPARVVAPVPESRPVLNDAPSPGPAEPLARPDAGPKTPGGPDPDADEEVNRRLLMAFEYYRKGMFNASYNTLLDVSGCPMSAKQQARVARALGMVDAERKAAV